MREACDVGSLHSGGNMGCHREDSIQIFLAAEDVDRP